MTGTTARHVSAGVTRYMLDTNIVSYLIRGASPHCRQRLIDLKDEEEACISVITEAELLYGLARRPKAVQLRRSIEALLGNLLIIPWNSRAAAEYAELRAGNEALGRNIGNLDLLIAAHAIAEDSVLVTNERGFSRLQGKLVAVNWADDVG